MVVPGETGPVGAAEEPEDLKTDLEWHRRMEVEEAKGLD
jgi:hypothetical protein